MAVSTKMASTRILVITVVAIFVAFQLGMVAHSIKQRYFARTIPPIPDSAEGAFDTLRGSKVRYYELSKPEPDDSLDGSVSKKTEPAGASWIYLPPPKPSLPPKNDNDVNIPSNPIRDNTPVYRPLERNGTRPPVYRDGDGIQPAPEHNGAQSPLEYNGAQLPLQDNGAQPPLEYNGAQLPLQDNGAQPPMRDDGGAPAFPHIKHDEAHPERTWKEGTFCHEFLTHTFQLKAPVCSPPAPASSKQESVECFGNPNSQSMATCTLRNIIVSPKLLAGAMNDPDNPDFPGNRRAINLLSGVDTECKGMTTRSLTERMEGGDYVLKLIAGIKDEPTQDVSVCDVWINETTFLFTGHRFHVYFRFLDYYNLHKLMLDMVDSTAAHPNARIIRMSGSDNYMFPEFDQDLFPEVKFTRLESLANVKTCFKKAVLIPKSYASPLFQCKNRVSLRSKCIACNGRGLNETGFNLFKIRVLNACSSKGKLPKKDNRLIILVSRTPYLRSSRDKLSRFERILDNEDQLARDIGKAFPNVTVQVVHLEKLSICEQITYSHNADVYMGVHGSGLVHLWWMNDSGLAYEMEPNYEVGNPTFHMLSRLTGRNYHSEHVQGGMSSVHTDVLDTINKLKSLIPAH